MHHLRENVHENKRNKEHNKEIGQDASQYNSFILFIWTVYTVSVVCLAECYKSILGFVSVCGIIYSYQFIPLIFIDLFHEEKKMSKTKDIGEEREDTCINESCSILLCYLRFSINFVRSNVVVVGANVIVANSFIECVWYFYYKNQKQLQLLSVLLSINK